MKRLKSLIFSFLALCLIHLAVYADPNKPITFEVGGATNGPGIAGKGELIIEEQLFDYESHLAGSKSYNYIFGDTKLRYGLIENRLEARIYSRGLLVTDDAAGFTNTSLGSKIRFLDKSKYLPSTELILDFEIPLGRKDLRNPGFDHSYMLVFGKDWFGGWASDANVTLDFASYKSNTDGIATAVSIPYAINLNHNIGKDINVFSHIFGTWSLTDSFPNPLSLDWGASYAVNNDLVFVTWISKGLNDAAPALSIDFGFAYRP